jgi:hypothetical protein
MVVLLMAFSSENAFQGSGPEPELTNWKIGSPIGACNVAPRDQGSASPTLASTTITIKALRRKFIRVL